MAMIKCKMCGGDLNVTEGMTVAECEYCGTRQTVPNVDNEKKLTLFSRANRLRLACEFDKAAGVYENVVAEFPEEAEAYWGLVLCRYGIEYVDDPATGKKVPTCHRSSFDSILEDSDFEQACENADHYRPAGIPGGGQGHRGHPQGDLGGLGQGAALRYFHLLQGDR